MRRRPPAGRRRPRARRRRSRSSLPAWTRRTDQSATATPPPIVTVSGSRSAYRDRRPGQPRAVGAAAEPCVRTELADDRVATFGRQRCRRWLSRRRRGVGGGRGSRRRGRVRGAPERSWSPPDSPTGRPTRCAGPVSPVTAQPAASQATTTIARVPGPLLEAGEAPWIGPPSGSDARDVEVANRADPGPRSRGHRHAHRRRGVAVDALRRRGREDRPVVRVPRGTASVKDVGAGAAARPASCRRSPRSSRPVRAAGA